LESNELFRDIWALFCNWDDDDDELIRVWDEIFGCDDDVLIRVLDEIFHDDNDDAFSICCCCRDDDCSRNGDGVGDDSLEEYLFFLLFGSSKMIFHFIRKI